MESIICPNCGGNRNTKVDNKHFKCEYCGTIFEIADSEPGEPEKAESKTTTQSPQVVYVQAPQTQPQQPPQIIIEKKSGNGCLSTAAVILLVLGVLVCITGGSSLGMILIIIGIIFGIASRPFNKTNQS